MNIKSLLLGSAAALVAVTGARAADAVVMVEPEPVEYVRVCDVYGTGFFYIPGTETCLKISGYLRMRVGVSDNATTNDLDNLEGFDADGNPVFDDNDAGARFRTRARLDFDAREETELGTLRAKIRVQATNTGNGSGTNGSSFTMDEGYLQLGGLTIGQLDSVWAGEDGGIGDGLFTDNDWSAGDFQQNRISYTYAANGFSGTLSVEDDGTGDLVPDVLAKLAYTGGFGGAYVTGVFDEQAYTASYDNGFDFLSLGDFFGGDLYLPEDYSADDNAFAVKAGIMLENLIAEDSAFKIEGHYAFDPTEYAVVDYVVSDQYTSFGADGPQIPSEYQIGAAYQQQFGKLFAAVSGVYGQTFDLETGVASANGFELETVTDKIDGADYYGVAVNVGYDITSNFSVLGEVSYRDLDLPTDDYDQTGGFIEFKRTF